MAANDAWAGATSLAGTSGSGSDNLVGATQETGEPTMDVSSDGLGGTLWYVFTPATPGVLSFTVNCAFGVVAELMLGDTLDTLVTQDLDASLPGQTGCQVEAAIPAGVPVYVRVYAQVGADAAPFTYSYGFTTDTSELLITLVDQCFMSPGAVVVHVGNLTPGDNVYFTIDNGASPVLTLPVPDDSVGITVGTIYYVPLEQQLLFVGVPVENADRGTHTLEVTSDVSGNAIVSFQVLNDSLDAAVTQPADSTLSSLPTTVKWVFRDPAPGGETYVWENDPDTMSSPFAAKVVAEEHTTAPDGQPLEWEGTQKAAQWNLTGTLFTQAQLEAFQRFAALDNRVWLIDHFKRAWVVTIEELDAEPQNKGANQYAWIHTWKMSLLIWAGPVDVS